MKKPKKKPAPRRSTAVVRHRNATARELASRAGSSVAGAARAARKRLEAPAPSAVQDVITSVVAGGGASLIAAWAMRKWKIDPQVMAAVMMAGGAASAFSVEGSLRTAAMSIAGAGAGQLALGTMQARALRELEAALAEATAGKPNAEPTEKRNALPSAFLSERLALHSQIADDAERFADVDEPAYSEAT